MGLAGWSVADVYSTPVVSATSGPVSIVKHEHQSAVLRSALSGLSNKVQEVATEAESPLPVVEPAAISVERLLRQRLKAILGSGRRAVLIVAPGDNETAPRRLKLGEEFHDRWIVSEIDNQVVKVSRDGEVVSVEFFNPVFEGDGATMIEGLTETEL
jgi:hypothetical protein